MKFPVDPLGFLTSLRKRALNSAIERANIFQQATLGKKRLVYDHVTNRGKSFITRAWGVGFIMESFEGDEGAVSRTIFNMEGIEFDKRYFVRFVKIEDPECPPKEPKKIAQARILAYQDDMFPEEYDNESSLIPLHRLYPVIGGYMVDKKTGLITDLYFIDQTGTTVNTILRLESLPSKVNAQAEQKPELPKTTYTTLKPTENKRDEA